MNIEGLFQSPASQLANFFRVQTLLYRQDPSLQDYFMQLQLDPRTSNVARQSGRRLSTALLDGVIHGADSISRLGPRRKFKADVLFCPMPYFGRKTENTFLVRTLLGLAQTDAKVLCLMPDNAPCRAELDSQLKAVGRSGQIEFIDPNVSSNSIESRLRARRARTLGKAAFEKVVSILEPFGLGPTGEVRGGFEHMAYFVDAWERLAPHVEFDTAVARCHWQPLCSPVCRTARERGKTVITFQQGVIGHTLDAPVTASKFVAFGQSSASFLTQVNRLFFQTCGLPHPTIDFVEGGSLYDNVTVLSDQFERQTLLMVDEPIAQGDFYGVGSQTQALLETAEKLLRADVPLRRLIIRPHPFWSDLDFEACRRLIRTDPMHCELSHPAWSLEEDLRRSSIAIGIFSGVLTVTSACGIPSFFIRTDRGYATGDLACFSPFQTLLPDATFHEIARLLKDREEYARARAVALKNARAYYREGENAVLDGKFFMDLLADG